MTFTLRQVRYRPFMDIPSGMVLRKINEGSGHNYSFLFVCLFEGRIFCVTALTVLELAL